MAQHDFVIDNQSAAAFRADLNASLAALATTNGGGTAPAVTFAGQLWHDTSANALKIRNEDNDAWITLMILDQAGDTAAPPDASVTFAKLAGAAVVTASETIASNNNDTTIPTSAAVKALVDAATSGASVGAVGTYAMLRHVTPTTSLPGATVAGSNLSFASAAGDTGGSSSGTWRLMGATTNAGNENSTSVWLRIS